MSIFIDNEKYTQHLLSVVFYLEFVDLHEQGDKFREGGDTANDHTWSSVYPNSFKTPPNSPCFIPAFLPAMAATCPGGPAKLLE